MLTDSRTGAKFTGYEEYVTQMSCLLIFCMLTDSRTGAKFTDYKESVTQMPFLWIFCMSTDSRTGAKFTDYGLPRWETYLFVYLSSLYIFAMICLSVTFFRYVTKFKDYGLPRS